MFNKVFSTDHMSRKQKVYTYKTKLQNLKRGDFAVVEGGSGMQVVQVVDEDVTASVPFDTDVVFRGVICRIPVEELTAVLEEEQDVIQKVRAQDVIRTREELRVKYLDALSMSAERAKEIAASGSRIAADNSTEDEAFEGLLRNEEEEEAALKLIREEEEEEE